MWVVYPCMKVKIPQWCVSYCTLPLYIMCTQILMETQLQTKSFERFQALQRTLVVATCCRLFSRNPRRNVEGKIEVDD